MKKYTIYCISLLLFTFQSIFGMDHEALARQVSVETATILSTQYPLQLIGIGGGAMYGIEALSLSFEINKKLKINEARKLVLACSELLLSNINNKKELRPFLAEYPFPISRIQLKFFVKPTTIGKTGLSVFGIYNLLRKKQVNIEYKMIESDLNSKRILSETYEEAQEKVKEDK